MNVDVEQHIGLNGTRGTLKRHFYSSVAFSVAFKRLRFIVSKAIDIWRVTSCVIIIIIIIIARLLPASLCFFQSILDNYAPGVYASFIVGYP